MITPSMRLTTTRDAATWAATAYGAVVLAPLAAPHISDDGHECAYASEWITQGAGDNPYRVRVCF